MNREFAEKIMEAKKMEKEAFLSLLDPEITEHIQVIESELNAWVQELLKKGMQRMMEEAMKQMQNQAENQMKNQTEEQTKKHTDNGTENHKKNHSEKKETRSKKNIHKVVIQ